MNVRRWPGCVLFLLLPGLLLSACSGEPEQTGFAGLAETVDEAPDGVTFLQPAPGDRLRFPRDWGEHPRHRIEWWYLTANLETEEGEPVGLQWTQFRQALVPRREDAPPDPDSWPFESVWMAHAALSQGGQHVFAERFARGDTGQAGVVAEPFGIWLDHWQLSSDDEGQWHLSVQQPDWGYELILQPSGRLVAHGDEGFSAKSGSGEGSMYFSDMDIRIRGQIRMGGRTLAVAGNGWLDREWSSQFLRSDQQGWDWFALRLDSGARLMAFRLREDEGTFRSGTWVAADGELMTLSSGDLAIEPVGFRRTSLGQVPVEWRIEVKPLGQVFEIQTPQGSYWNEGLYPYWESPIRIRGDDQGEGYMELTGYGSIN